MHRRVAVVFGGSGFIGRHLVRRLAADGWIVRVAVRRPDYALFLKPMGDAGQIVLLSVDVTDTAMVESAVRDVDAVFNLIGILYQRGKRTFQRMHVDVPAGIAEAAARAGARHLVHVSALGASADSTAAYARTKAAGEKAVLAAFPEATVLRPSVVFGPEDKFFNRFAGMARFMPFLPVFDTAFQPVYVGDVADAMMATLRARDARGGTYELGGPRVISFREVMELVMAETGRRRQLVPVPLALASVQGALLEWLPVPPLTRDQVELMRCPNVVSAKARTLQDLGITPTAVEIVVPTYLRRFRRYGPDERALLQDDG